MPRNRVLNRVFSRYFARGGGGARPSESLGYTLDISAKSIKKIFSDCEDLNVSPVYIGGRRDMAATLVYLDGLVQGSAVAEEVVRPLTDASRFGRAAGVREAMELILHGAVYNYNVKEAKDINELAEMMVNGFCAVIFERPGRAICFEVKSNDKRSVGEPTVEKAVKGAKDAFTESLRTNTGLLRRKMRSPNLKIRQYVVGRGTLTKVALVYVDGLTNEDMVEEVGKKLEAINIDGVVSLGSIEDELVDRRKTLFPLMIYTERVDKFAMNLLEGRVGIIVDGFSIAYLTPASFAQFVKVPEDKSDHFIMAALLTGLRYAAVAVTLLLPGFYVAVAMFNPEMLPTKLMLSIIESKQNVPFATATEVIGMLVAFEVLQEAGLRLPQSIGETVSIIGALVVGQSAVEAKVVSAVVVIIVAVSGICGYTMPNQDMAAALRVWRFVIVIAAVFGGMFGVSAVCTALVYHLASLETYGVSYISPLGGGKNGKNGKNR